MVNPTGGTRKLPISEEVGSFVIMPGFSGQPLLTSITFRKDVAYGHPEPYGGSPMSPIAKAEPTAQIGKGEIIYWLLLAIGCADLSRAKSNAWGRLISRHLSTAFWALSPRSSTDKTRLPKTPEWISDLLAEITFDLNGCYPFSNDIERARSGMMLVMSDAWYSSIGNPGCIEIRDQKTLHGVFQAAVGKARGGMGLTRQEKSDLLRTGQALADLLIVE